MLDWQNSHIHFIDEEMKLTQSHTAARREPIPQPGHFPYLPLIMN